LSGWKQSVELLHVRWLSRRLRLMDEEWNPGNFGNEEAILWLQKLLTSGSESTIREAVDCIGLYPEDEYLDAEYCSNALAAAEMIAAAKG
jgi:hypothetical protein